MGRLFRLFRRSRRTSLGNRIQPALADRRGRPFADPRGEDAMMLWIEGTVALIFVFAFLISSFVVFKPHHVAHGRGRVYIGAAIQGLTIGLIIGFVIVPLRMSLMNITGYGAPAPAGKSSLFLLPALLLLILVLRGVLLRAPILSTYLRAYRRATLLRTRDETAKQLAKLDDIEGRKAPA